MNHREYLNSLPAEELAAWIAAVENGDLLPDDYVCGREELCIYADSDGVCHAFDEDGDFQGCIYTPQEKIRMWLKAEYTDTEKTEG